MNVSAIAAITVVVFMAVLASRRVLAAETDRRRRVLQLLVCWLVPVGGPLLVFAAHRPHVVVGDDPSLDYQRPAADAVTNVVGPEAHHSVD
jgi:hypothetical protein